MTTIGSSTITSGTVNYQNDAYSSMDLNECASESTPNPMVSYDTGSEIPNALETYETPDTCDISEINDEVTVNAQMSNIKQSTVSNLSMDATVTASASEAVAEEVEVENDIDTDDDDIDTDDDDDDIDSKDGGSNEVESESSVNKNNNGQERGDNRGREQNTNVEISDFTASAASTSGVTIRQEKVIEEEGAGDTVAASTGGGFNDANDNKG